MQDVAATKVTVDVWSFSLDQPIDTLPDWLPEADRQRVGRMGTPLLRSRMAITRVALRQVLANYTHLPPEAVPIVVNAHGWPHLDPTRAELGQLWFNLTHADDRMLLAISRDTPLGIDLERLNRKVDPDKLADMVMNPADLAWLDQQSERLEGFMQLWTAKESVLKLWGTGLQIPAPLVQVDWDGRRATIDLSAKHHPGSIAQITSIPLESPWTAHLASVERPTQVEFIEGAVEI